MISKKNKKFIQTKKAPLPIGPYSQAIFSGNFLFLSGQIPIDPKTNKIIQGGIKEQTHQVMKNINSILKEAHLSFSHVIKSLIFLKDLKNFHSFNEVYSKYLTEEKINGSKNQILPARSCVEVSALPQGVEIEIEVIAELKRKNS